HTRPWIRFCLTAHYRQATTLLQRVHMTKRIWDSLEIEVQRQGLPKRSILALTDAAVGFRVRNATYRKAADISNQVASRDLKALADAKLLEALGEKKGRYYVASNTVKAICSGIPKPTKVLDPFEEEEARRSPLLPGIDAAVGQ
ncbi:hypothetical protein MYX65_12800, partial [Acidobacteria bacterium AH-259-L09]|nr:hypothetical protein [Acidobacteria bacterium AH-259-L09]